MPGARRSRTIPRHAARGSCAGPPRRPSRPDRSARGGAERDRRVWTSQDRVSRTLRGRLTEAQKPRRPRPIIELVAAVHAPKRSTSPDRARDRNRRCGARCWSTEAGSRRAAPARPRRYDRAPADVRSTTCAALRQTLGAGARDALAVARASTERLASERAEVTVRRDGGAGARVRDAGADEQSARSAPTSAPRASWRCPTRRPRSPRWRSGSTR